MASLSPAAQAVLDAYRSSHLSINNLAAALRAAVEQSTYQDAWDGQFTSAEKILAIAAELETFTPENQ
jgi:hypothetical protein